MQDPQRGQTNGHQNWGPPSPYEILVNIDRRLAEQNSRLGGLETGLKITLDAVKESFALHRDLDGRMTRVETLYEHKPVVPPPPPPETGWLADIAKAFTALKEVLPSIKEILAAILVILVALEWVVPEKVPVPGSIIQMPSAE